MFGSVLGGTTLGGGLGTGGLGATAAAAARPHNPNGDYEVPGVGEDSISDIAFSPAADYMLAASWDGSVCVRLVPACVLVSDSRRPPPPSCARSSCGRWVPRAPCRSMLSRWSSRRCAVRGPRSVRPGPVRLCLRASLTLTCLLLVLGCAPGREQVFRGGHGPGRAHGRHDHRSDCRGWPGAYPRPVRPARARWLNVPANA
jgi:hypothetical protein